MLPERQRCIRTNNLPERLVWKIRATLTLKLVQITGQAEIKRFVLRESERLHEISLWRDQQSKNKRTGLTGRHTPSRSRLFNCLSHKV